MTANLHRPIFFKSNRVSRVYTGGKLFSEFFGDSSEDGRFPEEWVASYVKAMNGEGTKEKDGVSLIVENGAEGQYFDDFIKENKEAALGGRDEFGVLVKLLDSAIRLPVQAHPDTAYSRVHFNSDYGKAEMWLVLATRKNAKIYFGFNSKVTPEQFKAAEDLSETNPAAMEELLNEVSVKSGDVFFIPAKMVHAIGYGCLILEVQEPTDFTIQPENWCGDYHLNEYEKYLGLDRDVAMGCFNFDVYGDEAIKMGKRIPRVYVDTPAVKSEVLVGLEETTCFSVLRHRVTGGTLEGIHVPAVCVVTDGEGKVECDGYSRKISKGDYFFLPHCVGDDCRVVADGNLELVECLPSGVFKA